MQAEQRVKWHFTPAPYSPALVRVMHSPAKACEWHDSPLKQ
jgi:hypothetical protein